jgi:peptidoglycan-N-acetylglucosamine deacetylase
MLFSLVPLTVALMGCATCYYSPFAWRMYSVRALQRRVTKDRILSLTYDDGPSSSVTPAVLELLDRHQAKASFFMLGRSAQQNRSLADRILEEGHDIGCHSDQHLNAWKVSPRRAVTDIDVGYDNLSDWVAPDGIYRPPYGKTTMPTHRAIRRRGARVGWWTIDSGDTHAPLPKPRQVAERLIRAGGGVVLMHDLDRSLERNEFVLETTALLLEVASRESFQVKRLSELCH